MRHGGPERLVRAAARGGVVAVGASGLPSAVLDQAVRTGVLVPLFRGTYVLAERAGDPATRAAAALAHASRRRDGASVRLAALSHTSALAQWRVLDEWPRRTHVSVAHGTRLLGSAAVFHQRRDLLPGDVTRVRGCPVVPLARAVVESWQLLDSAVARSAAFRAVGRRLTTPEALGIAARSVSRRRGAADLAAFLELLVAGCRSELELWGYVTVLSHPALPRPRLQLPVVTRTGTYVLDAAYPKQLLAVELDGAAFHDGRANRERDMRRDAALAERGWLVVRFSHDRLRRDPGGVRRQLRGLLDVRRRQLGVERTSQPAPS